YLCVRLGWEQALVAARNTLAHPVRLIGFQHATVSPLELNYFVVPRDSSAGPATVAPSPDVIACNGVRPLTLLNESAWNGTRFEGVEAIRHRYLRDVLGRSMLSSRGRTVTLLLSNSVDESVGLLSSLVELGRVLKDTTIYMRPHPFLAFDRALDRAGIAPGDFKSAGIIVDRGPLDAALANTRV